jgi:hypothetical protein
MVFGGESVLKKFEVCNRYGCRLDWLKKMDRTSSIYVSQEKGRD